MRKLQRIYFKQARKAISNILEADLRSKGVGSKSVNNYHILQDLMLKIFTY